MEKMFVLALSTAMALSLVTFGGKGKPVEQEVVEIPAPFVECDSLEEAEKKAGIPFDVPESIDGYEQRMILAFKEGDAMIEVIYRNETDENDSVDSRDEICMRKAQGGGDISGDYTEYPETGFMTVGDIQVAVKGEESTHGSR